MRENVGQHFDRRLRLLVDVERLRTIHDPQRVAGQRIERLGAPLKRNRQPAECRQVKWTARRRVLHDGTDAVDQHDEQNSCRREEFAAHPERPGQQDIFLLPVLLLWRWHVHQHRFFLRRQRLHLATDEIRELDSKMHDQADCSDDARHIRHQPARIAHHLEDRRLIVVAKVGLIKCLAAITQRMIHPDQDFTVKMVGRIHQPHPARIILGHIGAGISVVREMDQVHRVRLVNPLVAQLDLVLFASNFHRLRIIHVQRNQPRPQLGPIAADQRDICTGCIDSACFRSRSTEGPALGHRIMNSLADHPRRIGRPAFDAH